MLRSAKLQSSALQAPGDTSSNNSDNIIISSNHITSSYSHLQIPMTDLKASTAPEDEVFEVSPQPWTSQVSLPAHGTRFEDWLDEHYRTIDGRESPVSFV